MLYQLVATLDFARKNNNHMEVVLATGTQEMLCKEHKRWKKVASVWAKQAQGNAKVKPALHLELREL